MIHDNSFLRTSLGTLGGASALLAATLSAGTTAFAQQQAARITVETLSAQGGGSTLVVSGPAHARGLLVLGTEALAAPRPLLARSGLVLQVGLEPRAVIPFETDASGRWTTHADALPARLQAQALFPGLGLGSAGLGAGSTPAGSGYSNVTPSVSCPQPVKAGDLVISEVQRDPAAVLDSDGEWFELLNTTPCDIDIEGWRLTDEAGDFHFIGTGQGVIVPAGGRLVLGRNADPLQNGGIAVGYEYSNFTFDEAADRIVLLDALGVEMERVQWDLTWPTNEEGRALSLEPGTGAAGNDLPANWCLASAPIDPLVFLDFGTPGSTNPSCSCMGQEDLPDAGFVDANCDGIDGDRARAVFVAKSGTPAGLGTLTDPVDSIAAALTIAAADPALDHVYVAKGSYAELVQLVDGVSIWGGYDADTGWSRSVANLTEITTSAGSGGSVVALSGTGLAQPIVIGDLEVRAASSGAAQAGTSYLAARLHQVAALRFERVRLSAAAGTAAATGAQGPGYAGSYYSGGSGGSGGAIFSDGKQGGSGFGPGGGNGGSGGNYPGNGGNGGNGAGGGKGAQGSGAASAMPDLSGGVWSVPGGSGGKGGDGLPGASGGGGGGGSGGVIFAGGKGGAGGSGGRGGRGGLGAGPGGTSAALVVSSSQVELLDCVLEAGDGGSGGKGGLYYPGQSGSTGASGQSGSSYGYAGGKGGNGGSGGSGGYGGGGAGGSSCGIVAGQLAGVSLTGSTSILIGAAGAPGGPSSGAAAGLAADVLTVPE